MNTAALAFYTGYAFCQAINVQHVLEDNALMVPFVVHWQGEHANQVPYPAETQEEAVALAQAARERQSPNMTGWSAGREGLVALSVDCCRFDGHHLKLIPSAARTVSD